MTQPVISFIGAGHMGGSLIGGLIAKGYKPDRLCASEPDVEKARQLQAQWQIHTTQSNADAASKAEVVVIAVKPQVAQQVVEELRAVIQQKEILLISIMAGVRVETLCQWLATEQLPIVRCMPNTPALIHCGATGLFANAYVSASQKKVAETIFNAVGITVWLANEQQLDTVTALSGSGPAYFFRIMEALEKAAVQQGLTSETAHQLVAQTCYGAAQLVLQSTKPLAELRQQVTSKGGTTEQGLQVMDTMHIDELFAKVISAAQQRAVELGEIKRS